MSRIWQILLGIQPRSPGALPAGETTRLEITELPGGGAALVLAAVAVAILILLWWLPRRERQELSNSRRAWLVALRVLVLLAVAVMLLEPVLVSAHVETLRSHLPIIVDDSESMHFSDPYTDETRAARIATALKLEGKGGKSPVDRLRETPRLDLAKGAISPHLDELGKGRDVAFYDLESASKAVTTGPARAKPLEEIQPRRSISPLGDALRGVLAAHRGRPVAGIVLISDGRSNAGEDPLRVAEALARLSVPLFAIASGGEEGPRNVR
ncbi:MAG: vWA domain-containing protein, partial [Isosphaeraceae bacterium]